MARAIVVREVEGGVATSVETLDESHYAERDLLIDVSYSTLNYKDGMVMKGIGRLVRTYPHIPGVDMVGTVRTSSTSAFAPGDVVLATGYRIGERYDGGFSTVATLDEGWALHLPSSLTPLDAMAIGTAGLTSMLALMALERHGVTPAGGPLLVTGASGGVGSTAVALLAANGYEVTASTGRMEEREYLERLGASEVIDRAELSEGETRPLESERWAGCIDAVGGSTLGKVLARTKYQGAVAAVGLAQSATFEANVMPFLLRGISLIGIDSVMAPMPRRQEAWRRLGEELPREHLAEMTKVIGLEETVALAGPILGGKVRGRMVVDPTR
jgi:acrylyl-CoA reductase (NADPH)